MKDIGALMQQVQEMQARMGEMQAKLDDVTVEGRSGAGLVTVTMTAKGAMTNIAIDDSLMKADEKDILEDLIVAACADARVRAEAVVSEKMSAITGGMPLPPGFKMPFS